MLRGEISLIAAVGEWTVVTAARLKALQVGFGLTFGQRIIR